MIGSEKPTCALIRRTETFEGKQGVQYFTGVSAENSRAQRICLHLVTISPGGRSKAHLHKNHETAIYVLSGSCKLWYGEKLKQYLVAGPGDFIYIPPGMPHVPVNTSMAEPCVGVIARTDPNEQESVVPLEDLDKLFESRR